MMKRGITLIELIFSIVIISIVFSVVPKIIFASNKSMQTSMKEDSLFNAYTLLGSIIKLPWDENTYKTGNILSVTGAVCEDTRLGLFLGARECQKDIDNTASVIGLDAGDNGFYNDVDDYDGYKVSTNINGNSRYSLDVNVSYVDMNYGQHSKTYSRNLKEINVMVESNSTKTTGFKSSFFYYSANLGHIQIKKELWK